MTASRVFTVRKAHVSDARRIAEIHVASWQEVYQDILPASVLQNLQVADREEMWTRILRMDGPSNTHVLLLIEPSRGEVVGFIAAGKTIDEDAIASREIFAVYLLGAAQRRGGGTILLNEIFNIFRDDGADAVAVWVIRENPARLFYERHGARYARERTEMIDATDVTELGYVWSPIPTL